MVVPATPSACHPVANLLLRAPFNLEQVAAAMATKLAHRLMFMLVVMA